MEVTSYVNSLLLYVLVSLTFLLFKVYLVILEPASVFLCLSKTELCWFVIFSPVVLSSYFMACLVFSSVGVFVWLYWLTINMLIKCVVFTLLCYKELINILIREKLWAISMWGEGEPRARGVGIFYQYLKWILLFYKQQPRILILFNFE